MANDDVFDVIVIGAGPVGLTAAARAVRGGLSACVIERRLVGGECNYYGCIPSKALLWPMELAAAVGRMPGLKLAGSIDTPAVLARRDDFVEHYQDGAEVASLEGYPATFVRGQGRVASPLRVDVTTPAGGAPSAGSSPSSGPGDGQRPAYPGRARPEGGASLDKPRCDKCGSRA